MRLLRVFKFVSRFAIVWACGSIASMAYCIVARLDWSAQFEMLW